MHGTEESCIKCRECGTIKRVKWPVMDEYGGVFTCTVCERDLHPERLLNGDDPRVELVTGGDA